MLSIEIIDHYIYRKISFNKKNVAKMIKIINSQYSISFYQGPLMLSPP